MELDRSKKNVSLDTHISRINDEIKHLSYSSGRAQLLPVVGHSVATSNVWRLNPNNLRFTLNGPLPYTKVYKL